MNIDHESAMHVGVAKLELHFPHYHTLKEKRQGLRKIKDRIFARHKILVSEVGHNDKWQRTQLGFAVVSNDGAFVHALVDKIFNEIDQLGLGERIDQIIEVFRF